MNNLFFSFSVDDGHPLDSRIADLLLRHQLRATFYLPVRNIEGKPVMSPAQARELSAHFDIGSHTLEHRYLTTLDDTAAWQQIVDGKDALEQQIGRRVSGFCYPGGRYHRSHVALVQHAGFRYARTVRNMYPDAGHCPLEIPTTLQFYPHSRAVLTRNFIMQCDYRTRWPAFCTVVTESDWLMRLYRLVELLETRGRVFHVWCHAIDLEDLQLWKALDHFLGFIARHIPPGRRLDNAGLLGHGFNAIPGILPDHHEIV